MDAGNVKWVRLGDYIEQCDERNHSNKYGIEAIKGISTSKTFIDTKANLDGVPLQSYKLVAPRYFAYVPDTSRRGDKVALAFNDSSCTYLISSIYCVFKVSVLDKLSPEYLYLFSSVQNLIDMLDIILGEAHEKCSRGEICAIQ